jgi:hypothetical protein
MRRLEGLLRLYQDAVVKGCLGPCQFLGRSIDVYFYWDILTALGVGKRAPLRRLLKNLGRRGFAMGYAFTAGGDGVHGWLSPAETAELASGLFALPLPDYPVSFAEMQKFVRRQPSPDFPLRTYDHPTASFEELSLSFLRTVAFLAARENRGLLWGNDIGFANLAARAG